MLLGWQATHAPTHLTRHLNLNLNLHLVLHLNLHLNLHLVLPPSLNRTLPNSITARMFIERACEDQVVAFSQHRRQVVGTSHPLHAGGR